MIVSFIIAEAVSFCKAHGYDPKQYDVFAKQKLHKHLMTFYQESDAMKKLHDVQDSENAFFNEFRR